MKRILVCVMMSAVLLSGCTASVAEFKGTGSHQTEVAVRIVTDEDEVLYDGGVTIADNSPTAYMALKAAADEKNLALEINAQDTPDIMFLNGVSDIYSEDPKFWVLHVNGERAELGLGIETVSQGDVVEFIYQNRDI